MTDIKALIIDDEHKLREVLKIKLGTYCPKVKVLGEADNAEDAFQLIKELEPNLIFLDIQMPGESGFELLERFEHIDFEIVFVTGYDEYALKALKLSAVDYILKPIQTIDLTEAVRKTELRLKERQEKERYEILRHNISNSDHQTSKIVIPSASYYQFVSVNEIIHCEGWQKYTKIHLKEGEVIVSSYNIGVFRDILSPFEFYSPHKSHLINMHEITRYDKDGTIHLSNKSAIPVSRRRKEAFLEEVKKFGFMR